MDEKLTAGMKKALIQVGFGVRKYGRRFRSIEDPADFVDGRSLQALYDRKLINWQGFGGAGHQIHLSLRESGEKIFEEIRMRQT